MRNPIQIFYLLLALSITVADILDYQISKDDNPVRIVNGAATKAPITYQCSLQISSGSSYRHICSAVIISPDFALTAAHCIDRKDVNRFSIQAGVSDLTSTLGSRYWLDGYKTHEKFLWGESNDIAIIKVNPQFALSDKLTAINLDKSTAASNESSVQLSGWGAVDIAGIFFSPRLQKLQASLLPYSRCQYYYPKVVDSQMCTLRSILRGACAGDAGGPVTTIDGNNVIGIISYGTKPCGNGTPDVHTKIAPYVDWIKAQMTVNWTATSS